MPRTLSSTRPRASKKIVIKPFSKPPKLPPDFYEESSKQLLEATQLVLDQSPEKSSPQVSYSCVVDLVSHQYGPRLYMDLQQAMRQTASNLLTAEDVRLESVLKKYQQYVDYVLLCRHIFLPLDRTHLWVTQENGKGHVIKRSGGNDGIASTSQKKDTLTLWEVGLAQFLVRLQELGLTSQVHEEFWHLLWQDYKGSGVVDRFVLHQTIQMWQDLRVLAEVLRRLQTNLETQLSEESMQWMSEPYQPTRFVSYVNSKWMHVSTKWNFLPRTWLRTLIEVKLMEPHLSKDWLLSPPNVDVLLQDTRSQITVVWMLASRIQSSTSHNKLKEVVEAICQYTKRQGLATVQMDKKQMISSLLELHAKMSELVEVLPRASAELQGPLKSVWDEVLNVNMAVAESLAKHVDSQFRNLSKLPNVENYQNAILALFSHVQAKDVFEAFYKRDLAKRLLNSKVVSMDVERSFVTLLKSECGAGYTSKMEGMFQDVEWSRETMARYKVALSQESQPVDMEVQVLTTGYWPVYPQYNVNLPQSLQVTQERFQEHYKLKYQGRRMAWQYALGNCVVKACFPSEKKYELVVSLCQALVLLCFNSKDHWTLPELTEQTGIDDRGHLERILQSLSLGKDGTRVLRKVDHVEEDGVKKKIRANVQDMDQFWYNDTFTSQMRRIKITNIQWKETKEDHSKLIEAVSRDRLYLIDAVLVRILKARKTIMHQELMQQVMEQVKVPAQASDVKKRIESLIEREYMERDAKDRNRYNYLA